MNSKSTPRILQQPTASEPEREPKEAKEAKGAKGAKGPKQKGEGSYEATEDYQKSIKSYLDQADVKADAAAARPSSEAEARNLEAAEREGLSHSKARGQ